VIDKDHWQDRAKGAEERLTNALTVMQVVVLTQPLPERARKALQDFIDTQDGYLMEEK
jgi:hypothetical protein